MWAIYRKSDKKVVGLSADSEVDIDKEQALRETVEGLIESGRPDEYEALQVTDRAKALSLMRALGRGHLIVEENKSGKADVVDGTPAVYSILVTTEARDHHPADGVPLIPGDGESSLTVHIQKIDEMGKALERKKDNDELWLRTDHGTLRDEEGSEIRSLKLAGGKAAFRVHSDRAKRLATVRIFSADPNFYEGSVRVEFI